MRTSLERGQKIERGEGVEQLEHLEEARAREGLGENIRNHVVSGKVTSEDLKASNSITKELGGAQDVLGLLEGNGVKGHVNGGLGVTQEERRGVGVKEAKVGKERAEEQDLLGREGGAEVLRLGT